MKLPEYILEIIQKINDIGYEAYVVGGCVRDYLLEIGRASCRERV